MVEREARAPLTRDVVDTFEPYPAGHEATAAGEPSSPWV